MKSSCKLSAFSFVDLNGGFAAWINVNHLWDSFSAYNPNPTVGMWDGNILNCPTSLVPPPRLPTPHIPQGPTFGFMSSTRCYLKTRFREEVGKLLEIVELRLTFKYSKMTFWTHLIRFIAVEDSQVHLGQLVDTSRDVGRDSVEGVEIAANVIEGTIFDGRVTDEIMHVKQILAPVTQDQCTYIRCLGLNYMDHAEEANLELPKAPVLFTKPRTALAGPYPATINIPKCAQDDTSDYEAELCLVIGKSGRDIPEEQALEYVLGYTASNDVSARTMQMLTGQWSFSKGLDGSCPIGPVLVATSVIEDPQTLSIQAIHNGATVQDGHTKDMIFNIRKQISYLSQGTTLEAGTIFLTGTPAGIGYFRQPRVVLRDGDEISVKIDQIGTLVNKVRYESR
ncbi:unnamed protein product [Penicillium olsonii]|nr:unnamed protein product [Penicillium olsonii]